MTTVSEDKYTSGPDGVEQDRDRLRALVTELVEALDLAVFALDGKCSEHTMATLTAALKKAREVVGWVDSPWASRGCRIFSRPLDHP